MRILHYSLGLPPYRSGGLTKYAASLMDVQASCGNDVSLLYPAGTRVPLSMRIRKCKSHGRINVYRIDNPMPVPLLYGVGNPVGMMDEKHVDLNAIKEFFGFVKPDVLHVHTLMGLPKSFLMVAKIYGTKIVFTTHDYYGLCLKVNFIDWKGAVCTCPEPYKCALCNCDAYGTFFLKLRNEPLLARLKKIKTLGKVRHLPSRKRMVDIPREVSFLRTCDYAFLENYYMDMFKMTDIFHFNSSISKQVYEQHVSNVRGLVIPITHTGIKDNRRIKDFTRPALHIGYIGHTAAYKGFDVLKRSLSMCKGNYVLSVWGGELGIMDTDCGWIKFCGVFDASMQSAVYNDMDVLVVPSVWKETFSLVVLEALSYGVPVIVSDNVGAKDIVAGYDKHFVYGTEGELAVLLDEIVHNRDRLVCFNKEIVNGEWKYSAIRHSDEIMEKLYL